MVTITPERILQQSAEAGRTAEQVSSAAQQAGVTLPDNWQDSYSPVSSGNSQPTSTSGSSRSNRNSRETVRPTDTRNVDRGASRSNEPSMQFGMENTQNFTQEDFDARNQIIANQLQSRLQQASKTQRVDDRVRDEALMDIIGGYGGNVDRNDPNWMRTIDNIYGRVGKWDDYYRQLSNNFVKTDYTVDELLKTNPNQDTLNTIRDINPELYQSYMNEKERMSQLNVINSLFDGETEETTTITNIEQPEDPLLAMSSVLGEVVQPNLVETYNEIMNTPEIQNAQLEYNERSAEVERIRNQMNATLDDVRREMEGSGATEGYIRARAQKRIDELSKQYNDAVVEANLAKSNLDSLQGNAKDLFAVQTQQYQIDRQAMMDRYTIMSDFYEREDKYNYAKYQSDLQWDNFIREQKYVEGDMSGTPAEQKRYITNQVNAILEEFAGMPIQRSREQIVNDIYTGLQTGQYKSVGEALTKDLRDPIRSKPEYQTRSALRMGIDPYQIVNIGDMSFRRNPRNGNLEPIINEGQSVKTDENTYNTIDLGNGSTVSVGEQITIGNNTYRITQLGGSLTGGIDFAPLERGKKDPIEAFIGGEVVGFGTDNSTNNKFIEILGDNGYVYRYNHLDTIGMFNGQISNGVRIEQGDAIGIMGSTGISTGVHLDLAVYDGQRATNKAVSPLNIVDQTRIFFGGGVSQSDQKELTDRVISIFNNPTFKPQDLEDPEMIALHKAFLAKRKKVLDNPEATAEEILEISLGGANLTDTPIKELSKYGSVVGQLGDISQTIQDVNTGPIKGIISSNNPYNVKAQQLKAQLTAVIPALARGVYGEVGVLTDNDIRLYSQTIPNMTQREDVQKAVLAMTLKMVQRGMEENLKIQARSGRDVSGFIGTLRNITNQVETIETQLGINDVGGTTGSGITSVESFLESLKGSGYVNSGISNTSTNIDWSTFPSIND